VLDYTFCNVYAFITLNSYVITHHQQWLIQADKKCGLQLQLQLQLLLKNLGINIEAS